MAIFASTTTSGYSDPYKALSIKALEQRQKDMQAQMAAQQSDAAMMGTIPGGIGHVLGVVGDNLKEARTAQTLAANKEELARTMAGIDPEKGPTPEQGATIARLAPDIYKDYMDRQQERWKTETTERGLGDRNKASLTSAETIAQGNQGVQREGHGVQKEIAQGNQGVQREGHTVQKEIAAAGNQTQIDLATSAAKARREEAIAERDWKSLENRAAEAAANGQTQLAAKLKEEAAVAQRTFEEKQQGAKLAHDAEQGDKNREHDLEKIQRKAENDQAAARAEEIFKFEMQRREIEAKNKPNMSDLEKRMGIEKDYIQTSTALNRLGEAQNILTKEGGIDWGYLANLRSGAAVSSDGYTGDKALAERTIRFNGLMSDAAIAQMAARLKGQTTNFEMQKFIDIVNNPASKPEDRLRAVNGLVSGLNAEKMATTRVMRAYGGDPSPLDAELAAGRGKPGETVQPNVSGAPATAGATAAPPPPPPAAAGGPTAPPPPAAAGGDPLSRAQAALDQGAPYDAVAKLLQQKGGDPSLLKRKAP